MPEEVISILTGPVHCGKTSFLMNRFSGKENVYGILTPVVEGKRKFLDIATNKSFPMEAAAEEENGLAVGKYVFSLPAFEKAIRIISSALEQKSGLLLLDEVGPLELRGQGFYEAVKNIKDNKNPHLKKILVVRETILQEVIAYFGFTGCRIIPINEASLILA